MPRIIYVRFRTPRDSKGPDKGKKKSREKLVSDVRALLTRPRTKKNFERASFRKRIYTGLARNTGASRVASRKLRVIARRRQSGAGKFEKKKGENVLFELKFNTLSSLEFVIEYSY